MVGKDIVDIWISIVVIENVCAFVDDGNGIAGSRYVIAVVSCGRGGRGGE